MKSIIKIENNELYYIFICFDNSFKYKYEDLLFLYSTNKQKRISWVRFNTEIISLKQIYNKNQRRKNLCIQIVTQLYFRNILQNRRNI